MSSANNIYMNIVRGDSSATAITKVIINIFKKTLKNTLALSLIFFLVGSWNLLWNVRMRIYTY